MIIAENPFKMGYICGYLNWGSGLPNVLALGQPIVRDDLPVTSSQGASVPRQRAVRKLVLSTPPITSVVYAALSELTVTITRPGFMMFEYWLLYATSGAGEGIGVQLGYTGVANGIGYQVEAYTAPATRADLVVATAFDSGLAPYAAGPGAATPVGISIKGSANFTTVGDLTVQARAETGGANSATVLVGSWGFVNAIS